MCTQVTQQWQWINKLWKIKKFETLLMVIMHVINTQWMTTTNSSKLLVQYHWQLKNVL